MDLRIYGIRHHGPGSTRRLQKALREQKPDGLLVEIPADVEPALSFVGHAQLIPPVALLVYNPKNLRQAAYLPFAVFSPEWQAIRYAIRENIPVRAMDLPMSIAFRQKETSETPVTASSESSEEDLLWKDPLAFLARLAGYTDTERWWEATFEQDDTDTAVFGAILDLMREMRSELSPKDSSDNRIREAHMRKSIRKAYKEGFKHLAVVCGAWHAPALADWSKIPQKADNALLRGLKKVKTKATWIPWTYERLARQSGYGAGVLAPAWYALLYDRRQETATRWMIKVARLFRKEDLDASTAHVMSAVRLANTLAAMRGLAHPGIEELEEAAISVIGQGNAAPWQLIRDKLINGDVVGKVPSEITGIPLQEDFKKSVKSARLTKAYETTEQVSLALDLRKPANLLASRLLHRLRVLDIPWGELRNRATGDTGRFRERWRLKWRPDYALRLIEAGMYGNTIEKATLNYARKIIHGADSLSRLAELLSWLLQADLPDLTGALVQKMQEEAARERDVLELMALLPELVNTLRYGSVVQADEQALFVLIDQLFPRVFAGLKPATVQLEDEAARLVFHQIIELHGAVIQYDQSAVVTGWAPTLLQMYQADPVHPLIRGLATRLLYNQQVLEADQMEWVLQGVLSNLSDPSAVAAWLEGFLHGNGLLLIHQPGLLRLINQWVDSLPEEGLAVHLPILRRTFSVFSARERKEILKMVERGIPISQGAVQNEEEWDKDRAATIRESLGPILGLSR